MEKQIVSERFWESHSKQEAILRGWSVSLPVRAEQLVNGFALLADLSASWPTTIGHVITCLKLFTNWTRTTARFVSPSSSAVLHACFQIDIY